MLMWLVGGAVLFAGGVTVLAAWSRRRAREPDPAGMRTVAVIELSDRFASSGRTGDGEIAGFAAALAGALSRDGVTIDETPHATTWGWVIRVSSGGEPAWIRFERRQDDDGTCSLSVEQPLRGGPGPRWLVEAVAEAATAMRVNVTWHRRELYRAGDRGAGTSGPIES